MANILTNAPVGFDNAANIINRLDADILSEMCQEVLLFLEYKKGTVETANLCNKAKTLGCEFSEESIQSAINGLTYIYRNAAKNKLDQESLNSQLKASAAWSENSLEIVKQSWSQHSQVLSSSEQATQYLNIGQLVDMQWKLGMAMSSSSCKNLNSPYVSMVLKVADPSGKVITKSFEMSLSEFQNFSRQLKEMASILETV